MMNYNPFAPNNKKLHTDDGDNYFIKHPINMWHRIFGSTFSIGIFDYLLILPILLKSILARVLEIEASYFFITSTAYKLAKCAEVIMRILIAPFFIIKLGLMLAASPLILLAWGIKRLIEKKIKSPQTLLLNSLMGITLEDYPVIEPRPLSQIHPLCDADISLCDFRFLHDSSRSALILTTHYFFIFSKQTVIQPTRDNILIFHKLMKSDSFLRSFHRDFDHSRINIAELRAWIDEFRRPMLAEIAHERLYRLLVPKNTDIDSQRNPQHLYDVQKDVRKIIFAMVKNSDAQALPQQNAEAVVPRNNV